MARYDVVISSDVARTRTNGCIFFKLRDPSVDVLPTHYYSHKFVCVAPYNTDTLLLINIPKTMLEKVIKVSIIQSYQLSIFTHSLFTPTKKCNIHSRRKLPKTLLKEKSKIFLLQLIMVNPDSLLSLSLSCLDCWCLDPICLVHAIARYYLVITTQNWLFSRGERRDQQWMKENYFLLYFLFILYNL